MKNKLNEPDCFQPLKIVIIDQPKDMVKMRQDWDQLLASCHQDSPFLSYAWHYAWWMSYIETGLEGELSIVCVYQDKTLLALVPLYLDGESKSSVKSVRFIGQLAKDQFVPSCIQADILIAPVASLLNEQVEAILVSYFMVLAKQHNIKINCLSEQSVLYPLVRKLPKQYSLQRNTQLEVCRFSLPASFEGFIQSQSSHWLTSYQSYQAKLAQLEDKLEYRFYTEPHEMYSAVESFSQISCSQQRRYTKGNCLFDNDKYTSLHESLSYQLALKENGGVASLILDGHLLASSCYVVDKNVLHIYQSAEVKSEDFAGFSSSAVLMLAIVKQSIDRQLNFVSILSNNDGILPHFTQGDPQCLYNVRVFKNRGRVYLENSVRKLYRALTHR